MNKTIHYVIVINFKDGEKNVEILETNSLTRTKLRVILIIIYLFF
jgi:hypothetical protein